MLQVNNWLNSIQDWLFPPTCILCDNTGFQGFDLCELCYGRLPRNTNHCPCCAEIFEPNIAEQLLCGRCLSQPPAFDKVYAPFIHQEEIRYLITGLKFAKQYKNARLLGSLLAEYLKIHAEIPDLIVPVPLHPARYHERGFNQAVEIARTVAGLLTLPTDTASFLRNKDTPHQTGLSAKQRQQNLRKAFAIVKPIGANHVAIVDDVMTTGSTVNALAEALKRAGVNKVDVWVCARA